MTPKEKAEELIEKYLNRICTEQPRCGLLSSEAKQCALIAVDEIIEHTINEVAFKSWFITPNEIFTTEYWQQVKEEIIGM